ncbi:MAG: 5'/3'-nucleotidase SurE [Chloroflexi bacterium]|nr:MAG: 5'/3'-nucleotidase SurE [Chloroflexota bacterium]
MHILVTNDDGIGAPGLLALKQALSQVGKVTVLAPSHNWSASGHVKTMHKPLRVEPARLADGTVALTTNGAPSDAVALAFLGIVEEPIDMVVSGINPTANLGHDVTYSGTVTAAMEGAIAGALAIAVSLDSQGGDADYTFAAQFAARLAQRIAQEGLPPYTLLNVNVPNVPEEEIAGVLITRQGMRIYRDELVRRVDPRGKPYYWIGGDRPTGIAEEGTDIWALAHNYISITPLQLDMTAYGLMDRLREWDW